MAYYFAVETEENSYIAKNIRNSKYFGAEYRTNIPYECTLGEIDDFTTEFKDETSLKECLLRENILSEDDLDKKISIIFTRGIERRIVNGNILYSDSKSMLENPKNVIIFVKKKTEEKDYPFFRNLAEKLPNGTINKSLVSKLASLIEESLVNEQSTLDNNMIEEVAKLLIYRSSVKDNGSVVCNEEINTENLHNVLSFISEYERTKVRNTNYTKTLKNTSN